MVGNLIQYISNGTTIIYFYSDGTNFTSTKTLPHFNGCMFPSWLLSAIVFGIILLAMGIYLIYSRP